MKRIARALPFVLVLLALQVAGASTVSAALRDRSWEFGTFLSGAWLDNDSNVDNTVGLGLRIGYFFLQDHALEFSIDDVLTEVKDNSDLKVNLLTYKIGYLYTFMPRARVTPHIFLGGGVQNLTVYEDFCDNNDDWWDDDTWWGDCTDTLIDENDPVAYAGIGMRAFLGRSVNLRADFQANAVWPDDGNEDVLVDQILNVGVSWIFGGGR